MIVFVHSSLKSTGTMTACAVKQGRHEFNAKILTVSLKTDDKWAYLLSWWMVKEGSQHIHTCLPV